MVRCCSCAAASRWSPRWARSMARSTASTCCCQAGGGSGKSDRAARSTMRSEALSTSASTSSRLREVVSVGLLGEYVDRAHEHQQGDGTVEAHDATQLVRTWALSGTVQSTPIDQPASKVPSLNGSCWPSGHRRGPMEHPSRRGAGTGHRIDERRGRRRAPGRPARRDLPRPLPSREPQARPQPHRAAQPPQRLGCAAAAACRGDGVLGSQRLHGFGGPEGRVENSSSMGPSGGILSIPSTAQWPAGHAATVTERAHPAADLRLDLGRSSQSAARGEPRDVHPRHLAGRQEPARLLDRRGDPALFRVGETQDRGDLVLVELEAGQARSACADVASV